MKEYEINGKRIPVLSLDRGVEYLADFSRVRMGKGQPTMLLGAAQSSSGKGFVDKTLARIFGDAVFGDLDLDFYYYGNPWMEEQMRLNPEMNWDHPEAIELDLAAHSVPILKLSRPVMRPNYSKETAKREKAQKRVDPKMVMTISGNYGFYNKALREAGDLRYFILATLHSRIIRRLLRDKDLPGWTPTTTLAYFMDVVEPMARKYIVPDMKYADVIILNDLIPEVECKRAGLFHQQLKFRGALTPEHMRKHGAEHLLSGPQNDTYYTASDHDVLGSDMLVRIREEGGQYLFSMKGPKSGPSLCERAKFEFPISLDIARRFGPFYGKEVFQVRKEVRTLYALDGVVVAVDPEVWRVKGKYEPLGGFTEIRMSHDGQRMDNDKLVAVAEKLGLRMEDVIVKAYVDI